MKIESAINEGFIELKNNKIKNSLLDSEILMSEAIDKDRKYIILNLHEEISKDQYIVYRKLINERSKGKPIAYLIKKKSFWEDEFYIDEKVLIPRPDTEIIIEQILNIFRNKNKLNILEIGIGSGCILLSILKEKKKFFRNRP